MDRRGFFRVALASAGATAMLPSASMAGAATRRRQGTDGPYGSIEGRTPDENGLLLPEGREVESRALRPDGGLSTIVLGEERAVLVRALQQIAPETGAAVRSFSALGPEEVARLTGLDLAAAARAMDRQYDEPFLLENEERAAALVAAAQRRGLSMTRGGRFWHLTGATDKGRGMAALLRVYAAERRSYSVVALGDSPHDLPLLRAADRAIRHPRTRTARAALGVAAPHWSARRRSRQAQRRSGAPRHAGGPEQGLDPAPPPPRRSGEVPDRSSHEHRSGAGRQPPP